MATIDNASIIKEANIYYDGKVTSRTLMSLQIHHLI